MITDYSVLMSVYYKEKADYFEKSIESMLNQTIKPKDFVIVCDGPLTDELDSVIDKYTNKYSDLFQIVRKEKCSGLGNALNEGLKACKYDIVARMDTDDIAKEERVEKQLRAIEEKDADIVSGTVEEFDGDISNVIAKRLLPSNHDDIIKFARQRNPFNHPCVCFRKKAVLDVGSYMEFPLFEDYYLWVRMLQNGAKGYNIEDTILYMRAGVDMYNRRGGASYAKKALKFRWHLKKMGFSSTKDFVKSAGGQVVVSVMPNKVRQVFYKKVLRK